MKGADEYCRTFGKTQQIGRLYLVVSSHARGATFRVYVLPEGEQARPNGSDNPPLNNDAVEVYGITSGQPGWTETYGWLHKGKWKDDFAELYEAAKRRKSKEAEDSRKIKEGNQNNKDRKINSLLASYS